MYRLKVSFGLDRSLLTYLAYFRAENRGRHVATRRHYSTAGFWIPKKRRESGCQNLRATCPHTRAHWGRKRLISKCRYDSLKISYFQVSFRVYKFLLTWCNEHTPVQYCRRSVVQVFQPYAAVSTDMVWLKRASAISKKVFFPGFFSWFRPLLTYGFWEQAEWCRVFPVHIAYAVHVVFGARTAAGC